jgi:hypothetical protein
MTLRAFGLSQIDRCPHQATTLALNRDIMAHIFSINDNVHHQAQRPQGRADNGERAIYTIVARLPIEADGRIRYRIRSKTENFERVVTEDQISQLN